MKIRTLDYAEEFACLCGACPDTCCAGWDVEIDRESRERYLRMEGTLGDKACRALRKKDGEWSFRLDGGRCPFLTENGLCEMQTSLGEEALSRTCRLFPRIPMEFGGIREVSLSISCPEAARLLLTHGAPLRIVSRDTAEPVSVNDIDPNRYLQVMDMRDRLLRLARRRDMAFPVRLALCLAMAADAGRAVRAGKDMRAACREYENGSFLSAKAGSLASGPAVPGRAYGYLLACMDGMERLTGRWDGMLGSMRERADEPPHWDAPHQEYENLLVYYLFRYVPEAVYDGNPYLPVKLAAVSVCAIRLLWHSREARDPAARIDLAHLYSREVENSQDNLDRLTALLRTPWFGCLRNMKALILG